MNRAFTDEHSEGWRVLAFRSHLGQNELRGLRIRKYRHDNLLNGIWALRDNVTAYDAAYVTLARALKATLVTRDKRLAKVPGLGVHVTVP